jgi:hypothetical protein
MIAAYADVVGTAGLVLAIGGLAWQWWVRRTEPEQKIRVSEALNRHEARTAFLPVLRSEVLASMQFIDEPDGWRPPNVLVAKCKVRFDMLYKDWEEKGHLVQDADVRKRMSELRILDEIRWLDSITGIGSAEEEEALRARLLELKARLQGVLDAIESA